MIKTNYLCHLLHGSLSWPLQWTYQIKTNYWHLIIRWLSALVFVIFMTTPISHLWISSSLVGLSYLVGCLWYKRPCLQNDLSWSNFQFQSWKKPILLAFFISFLVVIYIILSFVSANFHPWIDNDLTLNVVPSTFQDHWGVYYLLMGVIIGLSDQLLGMSFWVWLTTSEGYTSFVSALIFHPSALVTWGWIIALCLGWTIGYYYQQKLLRWVIGVHRADQVLVTKVITTISWLFQLIYLLPHLIVTNYFYGLLALIIGSGLFVFYWWFFYLKPNYLCTCIFFNYHLGGID